MREGQPKKNIATRTFPNKVRAIRIQKERTLKACAEFVGCSHQAIHKVETVGKGLDTMNLLALAEFLEADLKDMLSPEKILV